MMATTPSEWINEPGITQEERARRKRAMFGVNYGGGGAALRSLATASEPEAMPCTGPDCQVCAARPELPPADAVLAEHIHSWDSQVRQYPRHGEPGITLNTYTFTPEADPQEGPECWGKQVWTLLYRNRKGRVVGIANYYPQDLPLERAGNLNVWVHPRRQRRGIGTKLITEADRRWGLNALQQRYTPAGRALVSKYLDGARG